MRQTDPKRPPKQVEPGGDRRNPAPYHSNNSFSRCAGVQVEPLFNELLGNKRLINADQKLKAVFGGKSQVSMFEMTKLINVHLH